MIYCSCKREYLRSGSDPVCPHGEDLYRDGLGCSTFNNHSLRQRNCSASRPDCSANWPSPFHKESIVRTRRTEQWKRDDWSLIKLPPLSLSIFPRCGSSPPDLHVHCRRAEACQHPAVAPWDITLVCSKLNILLSHSSQSSSLPLQSSCNI